MSNLAQMNFVTQNIHLVSDNQNIFEIVLDRWLAKQNPGYYFSQRSGPFDFEYSRYNHEAPDQIHDRFQKFLNNNFTSDFDAKVAYELNWLKSTIWSPKVNKDVLTFKLTQNEQIVYVALRFVMFDVLDTDFANVNSLPNLTPAQWTTLEFNEGDSQRTLQIKHFANLRCDVKGLTNEEIDKFLEVYELVNRQLNTRYQREKI